MEKKRVVVVGATGNLGLKIAKALLNQGADVTAMVRMTSNRSKLEQIGITDFVIGDMMNIESLRSALSPKNNFDAIVASAAGYTRHSKGDSSKTDSIGYKNLVDAAKEAGIPRFVLISILECDKAVSVPHFHNKYQIENYLREKRQPFIALRPGAFFDLSDSSMLKKIQKGVIPVFFDGVSYGTIYTPDLARYAAIAATKLPDSELNTSVDVGWNEPVNGQKLAAAFEKVLKKPMKASPVIPAFVVSLIAPVMAVFSSNLHDMLEMVRWVKTGDYISKNTERQRKLFGDLPTIEEAVRRYCFDKKLI